MFFAPGALGGETESSPKRRPLSPASLPDSQSSRNMSKDYVQQGDLTPAFLQSRTSDEENNNPPIRKAVSDDQLNADVEPAVLSALNQYIDTLRSTSGDEDHHQQAPRNTGAHGSPLIGSASIDHSEVSPEMLTLVEQYIDHLPGDQSAQHAANAKDKIEEKLRPKETLKPGGQQVARKVKAKVAPSAQKEHRRDLTNHTNSPNVPTLHKKPTTNQKAAEEDTTNAKNEDTYWLHRILQSQRDAAQAEMSIDSTLAIKPNHKSRSKEEDAIQLGTAARGRVSNADEMDKKEEEGSHELSGNNSVFSDSKMQRLIDAVEGWAGEGSFLDHPLLRDVSLDSAELEVLETLVAGAGSYAGEEQSEFDESTVPESLGEDLRNFLDSIQKQKRGENVKLQSTLIRVKKDPPALDEANDDANPPALDDFNDDANDDNPDKLSEKEDPPLFPRSPRRAKLKQQKKDDSSVSSETLGDSSNTKDGVDGKTTKDESTTEEEKKEDEKEDRAVPWWEATAKRAVTSVEETPWFQATAMLGVHAIEVFSGDEDAGSDSDSNSEEETIDAATADGSDIKPRNGVNDDIDQFWKSQNALRRRRQHYRGRRQSKKKAAELPTLNIASYSYNSQNSKRSEKSGQSASTVESFVRSKMSAESYDTMDERWLLKRSMAGFSFWGKPQFLTSKKMTVLEVDDPEPINGVESTKNLFDLSCRWRENRDAIFSSTWMLSYEERCSMHNGYEQVDFYSLSESSDVCDTIPHRFDNQPWERRDAKQFFLHEQSVTRRNWFGRLKRYSSVEVDLPVCRPRSMEMPVRAPEWTEDWYRTPPLRSLGTNLSDTAEGEATEYYRKYVLSEDEFEEEDEWEDTPECGTINNVYLKPGERISRVAPGLTSSLRRSRWRKKFFPKGTFPY